MITRLFRHNPKMYIILFSYCAILSVFILISGVLNGLSSGQWMLQLLFVPVPLYFLMTLFSLVKQQGRKVKKLSPSSFIFSLVFLIFLSINAIMNISHKTNNMPFLSPLSPSMVQTVTPTSTVKRFVVVKKEYVKSQIRIRTQPNIQGSVIANMDSHITYPFLKKVDDWYQIGLENNQTGFVKGDFVSTYQSSSQKTP